MKMSFQKEVSNRLFQISSSDIATGYDFLKSYSDVFGLAKDRISKGRWAFPINKAQASTQVGDHLFFKLDTANLEGFLNIEVPTIEESLEFTFKRLGGISSSNKKPDQGEGVKFI